MTSISRNDSAITFFNLVVPDRNESTADDLSEQQRRNFSGPKQVGGFAAKYQAAKRRVAVRAHDQHIDAQLTDCLSMRRSVPQ